MSEASRGMREIEDWLSPSEAGDILGTSGQWVTKLARKGELDAIRTSLGWLVNPADVERLANDRLKRAEQRVSAMKKAARATGTTVQARRSGRGRTKVGGSTSA